MFASVDFPQVQPLLYNLGSLWSPPQRMPLSQWAEENIVLSSEYAASTSQLKLFGWQREIFDCFTNPDVTEIDLNVGTQLVKTLFMQTAIAYVICRDPGPIMLLEPKDDDAKAFARERFAPMLRDCPALAARMPAGSREGNTLQTKEFPGGSLSLVGARTPGNLARRTIRYLFCDEIDKYPLVVGTGQNKEGDPISLAEERQATFRSRKKRIKACSPTTVGLSRILQAYNQSDMRKPWVKCSKCGLYQLLKWPNVRWDSSISREHQPKTAYYQCTNLECNARWYDSQRWAAADKAEWRAERPFTGAAGFWLSHLYSPWKTLTEIVAHFLKAKDDPATLHTFVNTVLAEGWQGEGETPDAIVLYNRREPYPHGDDAAAVIPQRGLFLTSTVDVQESPPRLEVETVAWGRGRENWSIDYRVLQVYAENGQPLPVTSPELWAKLDADVLQKHWPHESGHTLPIMAMGIDTGRRPKPVYEFARKHQQLAFGPAGVRLHAVRTVVPLKGTHGPNSQLRILDSVSKEDAARQRQGVRIVGVGTVCAKTEIYDALQHARPRPDGTLSGEPVPNCYHFPYYDRAYFEGLCSEVRKESELGKVEYEPIQKRNEPLDLKVYNRGMAAIVGIDRFGEAQWRQLEEQVQPTDDAPRVLLPDSALMTPEPLVVAPGLAIAVSVPVQPAQSIPTGAPAPQIPPRSMPARSRPVRGSFTH